jgi:alkylated DNA repair dioxygenase AlkB
VSVAAKRNAPAALTKQGELFAAAAEQPPGFRYGAGVVAPDEESALIEKIARLPFQPFDFHGHLANRRVVSFGWRYDYTGRALRPSDPVPDFLLPLRERAAVFAGLDPEALKQVLVTEYPPGAGIGWHRDKPMFEDIIAFSFCSACALRFRRKEGERWARANQMIAPRSVYLLRGPARFVWEHSIPAVEARRYSVTFRNFCAESER